MSDEQLVADLKASKAALKKHGRCTQGASNPMGQICIALAVGQAVTVEPHMTDWPVTDRPRFQAVTEALMKVCPSGNWPQENSGMLIAFNESPHTTDQDVYDLFDKALADLGGML